MGNCKSIPIESSIMLKDNRKVPKHIKLSDAPIFIPPISKYGKILDCVTLNHFVVVAYMLIPNTPLFSFNIYLHDLHVPDINSMNETERFVANQGINRMYEIFLNKRVILSNVFINNNGNYIADIRLDKKNKIVTVSDWLCIHNYGFKKTQKNKNKSWYSLYSERPVLINPNKKTIIDNYQF
tara:strand:- start:321 stop:866 length:546 start_codon:yes stop_codon:yes gene_type:complete